MSSLYPENNVTVHDQPKYREWSHLVDSMTHFSEYSFSLRTIASVFSTKNCFLSHNAMLIEVIVPNTFLNEYELNHIDYFKKSHYYFIV